MSEPIKLVIDYDDSMVVVNAIEGVNEALAKAGISWEFVSDDQPHDGQEVYHLKEKK
jgi:hypothetical protein